MQKNNDTTNVYTFMDFNNEEIKVFLPKFEINKGTMAQIKEMSRHLILKHIRIMPDCHRGTKCVVGMTAQIQDKIFPLYVGSDIGCGITAYKCNSSTSTTELDSTTNDIVIPLVYDATNIVNAKPSSVENNTISNSNMSSSSDNQYYDLHTSDLDMFDDESSDEENIEQIIQIDPKLLIKQNQDLLIKIEKSIQKVVPMGANKHDINQLREEDWQYLTNKNNFDLEQLKQSNVIIELLKQYPDYKFPEKLDKQYIEEMILKIGGNFDNDIKSIGTLGGGNHYVEINYSDVVNVNGLEIYITVHSGSRNIGSLICQYHQSKISETSRFDYESFNEEMKRVKRQYRNSKILFEIETKLRNKYENNRHTLYLEGPEMLSYLVDMIVGQNLASLNRKIMIRNICEELGSKININSENFIETKHNYIDFNRFLLRKGSISAEKGEKCIISLNMKEGILLCEGKGNPDWNYSAAHGCGRILQRGQTNKLSMKQFTEEMKDVFSTCVRKETLDESPMAYRNSDLVKSCLDESVYITKQLKPLINCKGF